MNNIPLLTVHGQITGYLVVLIAFGIDFKLQVPPLLYKIKAHNISDVINKVVNPTKEL